MYVYTVAGHDKHEEVITPDSREHIRGMKDATWEEVLHNLQNAGHALRYAVQKMQK